MKAAAIALCALAAATAIVPSAAHDHATGIVKERMDAMESMAKHNKAISARMKAKRDFSGIKTDAEAIAGLAKDIPRLFPPGSTQHPTRARAAIWKSWADFESKAAALETASRTLAAANPGDAAAITAAAAVTTRACTACHEKYRARK
jgi:cytochrome c556